MSHLNVKEHLEVLKKKRRGLTEKIRETKKKIGSVEGPMRSASSHVKQDLEGEVLILEEGLERARAQIKDLSGLARPKGVATIVVGSQIRLLVDGEVEGFLITKSQSDPAKGLLSSKTPLGSAILGRKKNESLTVELPGGEAQVTILEVL